MSPRPVRRPTIRLFALVGLAWLAAAFVLLIATARPAAADNCSSPGDCEQTGGYNGIIAVVGGLAAVAAAAAAVGAQARDQETDVGILQVSDDRIELDAKQQGVVTLTGWHAGPGGTLERVAMPLHIDVPLDSGLSVTPTDDVGELVGQISVTGPTNQKEVTLTASGTWKEQTVTQTVTVVVPDRYDVIVVGGGLAGLMTARRLDEAGRTVLVLEARPEVGGRMVSQELVTFPGVFVDLGGQWVGHEDPQILGGDRIILLQDRILALAEDLGISRFTSYHEGLTTFAWGDADSTFFEGEFPPFTGDPPAVSEGELADAIEVWEKIQSEDVGPEPWTALDAWGDDNTRLSDWLDEVAKTTFGKFVVTMMAHIGGSGGFEPNETSFLHMRYTQRDGPQRDGPESLLLTGSAGQIPARLVNEFSPAVRVVCDAPVASIEQHPDTGVIVSTSSDDFYASKVVVAMPPCRAAEINYVGDPPMPPERTALGQNAPMGRIIKVHAVYPTAFWRKMKGGLNGAAVGDLDTVEITADSSDKEGVPGILTSFIAGDRATALSGEDPESAAWRKHLILQDYVRFFGPQAAAPVEFVEKNWLVESWIGGAFTSFMTPGAWTRYGPFLRDPVGHIHWAGTEVATRWPGYFDGAVRSGEDAAAAILPLVPSKESGGQGP